MLSLRTSRKNVLVRPQRWAEIQGLVVGLIFVVTVLFFQPFGLDQFVAPKLLVLLLGAPLILASVAAGRRMISGDLILVASAMTYLTWSISMPLIHARNTQLHGLGAVELTLTMVLFVGVLGVRRAESRAGVWLVRLVALPSLVLAGLAIAQRAGFDPLTLIFDISSTRPGRWRVLTTLGNPTWTAELLVLSLPFVLIVLKPEDRLRNVWVSFVGFVFALAVAVTGSRGALLALVVVVGVCWRCGLIPRVRNVRPFAVGGVIIAVVVGAAAFIGRIAEVKPLTGRIGLWTAGVHLLGQEPLTGSGLRHTNLILPEGLESVVAGLGHEHHRWLPTMVVDRLDLDWLQVAVEQGLPALLLLMVVWIRAIVVSVRRFRSKEEWIDGAVIAVMAAAATLSCFSSPLHTPATAAIIWIVLGLAAASPGEGSQVKRREGSLRQVVAVIAGLGAAVVVGLTVAPTLLRSNGEGGVGHRQLTRGHYQKAADTLKGVVVDAPWLPGAAIDRSRALIATGEAAEALVILKDVERWTSSEWIWAGRARALHQLGLVDEARNELDRGFMVLPQSPVLTEAWSEIAPGGE